MKYLKRFENKNDDLKVGDLVKYSGFSAKIVDELKEDDEHICWVIDLIIPKIINGERKHKDILALSKELEKINNTLGKYRSFSVSRLEDK